MKVNFLAFLPALTAGLLFPFCLSGQNSTVTRALSSFDKIGVSGGFDVVFLKKGDSESVTLDVSGIDADNIETEVKDGRFSCGSRHFWLRRCTTGRIWQD